MNARPVSSHPDSSVVCRPPSPPVPWLWRNIRAIRGGHVLVVHYALARHDTRVGQIIHPVCKQSKIERFEACSSMSAERNFRPETAGMVA